MYPFYDCSLKSTYFYQQRYSCYLNEYNKISGTTWKKANTFMQPASRLHKPGHQVRFIYVSVNLQSLTGTETRADSLLYFRLFKLSQKPRVSTGMSLFRVY